MYVCVAAETDASPRCLILTGEGGGSPFIFEVVRAKRVYVRVCVYASIPRVCVCVMMMRPRSARYPQRLESFLRRACAYCGSRNKTTAVWRPIACWYVRKRRKTHYSTRRATTKPARRTESALPNDRRTAGRLAAATDVELAAESSPPPLLLLRHTTGMTGHRPPHAGRLVQQVGTPQKARDSPSAFFFGVLSLETDEICDQTECATIITEIRRRVSPCPRLYSDITHRRRNRQPK